MGNIKQLKRAVYGGTALVLGSLGFIQSFAPQVANAYNLLSSRSVQMSSSAVSATDVSYLVTVTTPDTQDIGGAVIEFCSDSPIIGDACTAPTDFDLNLTNLVISGQSGITDWTEDAASTANRLVLARTSASFTAGTFSLTLGSSGATDGVDNPSTLGTFYARILTFETTTGAQDYLPADIDNGATNNVWHAGGVALSTANQITITSKVQERLTFCVFVGDPDGTTNTGANDCVGKTGNAISLGDDNGVLSPTDAFINRQAQYAITTNAQNNAVIRVQGKTLESGGNSITANATPDTSTPGNEEFGLCTYQSRITGTANLTIDTDYDGGAGTECSGTVDNSGTTNASNPNGADFTFNTTNTNSTYGDIIATKPPGEFSTGRLAFIGNISNVTEAGIYTTTLTFIATGTY